MVVTYRSRLVVVAVAVVLTAMVTSLAGVGLGGPEPAGEQRHDQGR
jgi:ABC-type enterobactin transport system permease subunit